MFRNYLKVAWRTLSRNKAFSFINIAGLALGMASSMLILLWVHHERQVDNFHSKGDRLYSIYEQQFNDGKINAFHGGPGVMPDEIKKVIPEIEMSSGYGWNNLCTFQVGDKIIKESGNFGSPDFFRMFSYPLLEGKPETALSSPECIAISRKMANDLFGSPEKAIGQTVRYQNQKDFRVSAVFENLDNLNSQKFDFIGTWHQFLEENSWAKDWTNNGPRTYILLRQGANVPLVRKKIYRFLDSYNKEQTANDYIRLGMQRFGDMYLHSNFKDGKLQGGRIEYIRLFTIVAFFILLIACINFMNLTTARSMKRAKEIGVRKVSGAVKPALVGQFMGEALFITFLSVVVALGLVWILLPAFSHITGSSIDLPWSSPIFWLALLGLTLVTGFISGSYPALFLSSFQPIRVLKGTMRFGPAASWFRKGLVVFQFVLSIILITGTIVVSKQIHMIQTINLGFDRQNLIYIPLEGDLTKKYELFKQSALQTPGISEVTRITQTPTDLNNSTGGVYWEGKDPNWHPEFVQVSVGYDFTKTMNLDLERGRDFSKDFATDSTAYLLNEAAAKVMGFKDPVGQSITFWDKKGPIVGVVKDFHFNSLHEPIYPIVIRLGEDETWGYTMLRVEAGKTQSALAGLEKLCRSLNPSFPFSYQFADEEFQHLYTSEQIIGRLSNYFAFLAIFISCLGLLGLAMFTAEQRVKEFGIRKVLGAGALRLFALLSREFILLVGIAFAIAVPLAWLAADDWLKQYAYRTEINWWVFGLAGLLAFLIALVTVSYQAFRAARSNPVSSLRSE